MDNRFEPYEKQPADSEILFSKTVKAGKRVYYLDVKRDRRHALSLSITESKRVGNATEGQRPAFEKHKVFLYAEDLQHFAEALGEGCADAALAASVFHFGEIAIGDLKRYLSQHHIDVRL